MDYRKERNFIVAYDGDKCRGKWDMLKNEYIGIKGGVVKSKPTAFLYNSIFHADNNNVLVSALRLVYNQNCTWRQYNETKAKRLEEVLSLNLYIQDSYDTWNALENDHTKLTKECVKYIIDNFRGIYSSGAIESFKFYKRYSDIMAGNPEQQGWICEVFKCVNNNVPEDFTKGMIKRGIHEKVFVTYRGSSYATVINNWYKMITELNDKLEVKPNVITNYLILTWVYDEYNKAHYDEALEKNNNKPFLYFETAKYIAYPMTTRKQFHDEASAQHNCVESMYMKYVHDGITHVVVVRNKSQKDKSLITCEVKPNSHRIYQYLYACNQSVKDAEMLEFKRLYQEHLLSSLNK